MKKSVDARTEKESVHRVCVWRRNWFVPHFGFCRAEKKSVRPSFRLAEKTEKKSVPTSFHRDGGKQVNNSGIF